MQTQTYNGWTNYETWNVALWLDNEQGSYNYWQDRASECYDEAKETPSANARLTGREPFSTKERATFALADALKDEIEEGNPLQDAGMYSDLLGAAISEVNWHEIAGHYLDDFADEPETTEDE